MSYPSRDEAESRITLAVLPSSGAIEQARFATTG